MFYICYLILFDNYFKLNIYKTKTVLLVVICYLIRVYSIVILTKGKCANTALDILYELHIFLWT